MSSPNDIWTCDVCGFTRFDNSIHNCANNLKSEITLLRSELESCHKDIDTVLDNRNVGMNTGNSSLSFRVAELVSNHQSLRAELERVKAKNEWIPCETRLPESNQRIEFYVGFERTTHIGYRREHATQWESENGGFWHGSNYSLITHWRPLPTAPEEGE